MNDAAVPCDDAAVHCRLIPGLPDAHAIGVSDSVVVCTVSEVLCTRVG
jgi:hypothetical protein